MDSTIKQPRKVLLFFMPDYVLKSMKAQGVHLSDLVDLYKQNQNSYSNTFTNSYTNVFAHNEPDDRFHTESVDNLKTKISNSLSKQDYTDLWLSNIVGASLIFNKFSSDFVTKVQTVTNANSVILYGLLDLIHSEMENISKEYAYDLNDAMLREFVSSMVDNSRPILEKSMEESDLVQFEVVEDVLFIVLKKGFFNFSLSTVFYFRNLFLSTLLISLFRFFPEEDVYNSKIFSSILQIFYKQ